MTSESLVIGTRGSALALWQTEFVVHALERAWPGIKVEIKHISTKGDRTQASGQALPAIGGKGLFTAELEAELVAGSIDLAVHSLKDLPTSLGEEFVLGAVFERESAWDALISLHGERLSELPPGSIIGSSSVRRSAQIKRLRPDLEIQPIRGNVDSRLRKLKEQGTYRAIVLAHAGLKRLGLDREITQLFSAEEMLPAPGQGALAAECRAGDERILKLLKPLDHLPTRAAVTCERAYLNTLDAGCNTPVAAYAIVESGRVTCQARAIATHGGRSIETQGDVYADTPEAQVCAASELGERLARETLDRGFAEIELVVV